MPSPECSRPTCYVGGHRLDPHRNISEIALKCLNGAIAGTLRHDEHLRERARRDDLVVRVTPLDRSECASVMEVARIEQGDHDAGVEY